MWLLNADQSFVAIPQEPCGYVLDPTHINADMLALAITQKVVKVPFASPADGRGFSIARQLRSLAPNLPMIATGHLTPDQARHAFQSGFTAIALKDELVQRHTEDAWRTALSTAVSTLYHRLDAHTTVWHARHLAA